MNLWVSMEDEGAFTSGEEAFAAEPVGDLPAHRIARRPAARLHSRTPRIRFEDQVRAVLDAKVPAFSFIFGIPPGEVLEECRKQGIVDDRGPRRRPMRPSRCEDAGVDVVAASGFEAGGHRGSFLRPSEESLTGTFSLVPQVADAGRRAGRGGGRDRRRAGRRRRPRPRGGGRADGDRVPGLRGVGRERAPPAGVAERRGRTYGPDEGLHRQAGTGDQEPVAGRAESDRASRFLPYPLQRAS